MPSRQLIDDYLAGPVLVRQAIAGMTEDQLDAKPVPGKWSTRQVVAHLADFEPVYADRFKRMLAEDRPTLFGGDPDRFAAALAYEQRDVEVECRLIEAVRRHVGTILTTLDEDAFTRVGIHSEDGPVTVETLLRGITAHIPHHVRFIEEKRRQLGI